MPSLVTSTSTVMRPRTLPSSSARNSLVITEYWRGSFPKTALTYTEATVHASNFLHVCVFLSDDSTSHSSVTLRTSRSTSW